MFEVCACIASFRLLSVTLFVAFHAQYIFNANRIKNPKVVNNAQRNTSIFQIWFKIEPLVLKKIFYETYYLHRRVKESSVRNVGCPCARDNQKRCRTTKNTDAVVRQTTINLYPKLTLVREFHLRRTKNLDGKPEIVT